MNSSQYLPIVLLMGIIGLYPFPLSAGEPMKSRSLPPIPLSVEEIHAWIDRSHPLLRGAGTEKVAARGKMLKALGAFEPTVINDTEVERFISSSNPGRGTQTAGFNDTLVEAAILGDFATARECGRRSAMQRFPTFHSTGATIKSF